MSQMPERAVGHVVLLGDSIFDNAAYVPDGPPVIEQLRARLPAGWKATLLAVDGAAVSDVARQLARLPAESTHLVVSAGGNDALENSVILRQPATSAVEVFSELAGIQVCFRTSYLQMLAALGAAGRPTAVCTIYDSVPDLSPEAVVALGAFNDVIIREAARAGLPILDLRLICDERSDYSTISPIEPSKLGGFKIARAIAGVVTCHDFRRAATAVYTKTTNFEQ
jgi:hypothetical protein